MPKRKLPIKPSQSISKVLNYITTTVAENPLPLSQAKYTLENVSSVVDDKNRFKGCSFSPDGSCILTTSETDALVRIYDVQSTQLVPSLWIKETSIAAYDAVWYPLMQSTVPVTCGFITIAKNTPVHLWDAYSNNTLRASYTGVTLGEEPLLGAISISVNVTTIFAGARSVVHTWDINRPGRTLNIISFKECRGMVSSLDSLDNQFSLAFGTYTGKVGIVDLNTNAVCFLAQAQQSGVTRVRLKENLLWVGGRRSKEILCFDVRMNRNTSLFRLERNAIGNQKIDFDLSGNCEFLLSGCSELGTIEGWSLLNTGEPKKIQFDKFENLGVVNCASFDPSGADMRFCMTTGSRPVIKLKDDDDDENNIDNERLSESSLSLYNLRRL